MKRQMSKKTRKYWGLTEESDIELRKLQIFIEETGQEFKEIKEKVEDCINKILIKAENGDRHCLDLVKIVEQNYILGAETEERKIDLMGFGKKNSVGTVEIRTHIQKISKDMKGNSSPYIGTPKNNS